jgi:Periplasmic protease
LHNIRLKYYLLFLLAAFGCEKEPSISEITDVDIQGDEVVIKERIAINQWIFSNMKAIYFWSDQLKDSLDYDYSLGNDDFFKSMKVAEDRFSFCEANDKYSPTKGVDLNHSVIIDSVYNNGGKRIGYFYYVGFETEADVIDVILKMKGVDELIIDERSNHGGYVATCTCLASMLVPIEHLGDLFYFSSYNDNLAQRNLIETGSLYTYTKFKNDALTRNRSLNLSRLWVLTGKESASCSELLINGLRPYMDVKVIGEKTVGKDVGMSPLVNRRCKFKFWPITFRSYNSEGVPVPTTGIEPDIPVENTASYNQLGQIDEPLLSRAFEEIINNN